MVSGVEPHKLVDYNMATTEINIREQYARYGRYFTRIRDAYLQKPVVQASLGVLLTLFTISFFSIFALRPTLNTISELLAQIRTQKEILEQLDQKIAAIALAQQVWTQELRRIPLVLQALPKNSEPETYLRQIEGLTIKHNLSLSSFKVDDVPLLGKKEGQSVKEQPAGTDTFTVSLSVRGSYSSLLSFLDDLETLRRPIKIESLSFGGGKTSGSILLTVSGKVPYKTQ